MVRLRCSYEGHLLDCDANAFRFCTTHMTDYDYTYYIITPDLCLPHFTSCVCPDGLTFSKPNESSTAHSLLHFNTDHVTN